MSRPAGDPANPVAGRKAVASRRPISKWRTSLQAPAGLAAWSLTAAAVARAAPGGSMLVRQRLLRSAPALIFLLVNLFLALSLGGYDPADAP